jgi:nitrilase
LPSDPTAIVTPGGSCIVNPMGDLIAGPIYDKEAILTADLDLGDIVRGKFDFDAVGHYARPDVFQMTVNEMPALTVRAAALAPDGQA